MSKIELLERALKLPDNERAELANELLDSLETPGMDAEWWNAWMGEIERRSVQYERGEIEAEDVDVAMAKIRQSLLDERNHEAQDSHSREERGRASSEVV